MKPLKHYARSMLIVMALTGCSSVFAQITIQAKSQKIRAILPEIEEKSKHVFFFSNNLSDLDKEINLQVNNKPLQFVLDQLFRNTNIAYKVDAEEQIILSNKTYALKTAQQIKNKRVTGVVLDEMGEPIIGASVLIKDTKEGTITDYDGNFILEKVPENSILVVSYIGYASQNVKTGVSDSYKVKLKEDVKKLNEVVVTAMGIERKAESLTYATQKVGGKELTRAKDVNFVNSLQGKAAGLIITPNSSGAGGGSSKIILRGQTSIMGNNQPLIVVDGIPMSNGMSGQTTNLDTEGGRDGGDILSTINPDDIADISILKGPNAAALYGSAANNGVIIITTKTGREGKVRVDVSSNITFETPHVYPKVQQLFAPEILGTEVSYNGWGQKISDITDDQLATFPYLTRNPRNNISDFFTTGQTYNNSVSLSGGTENSTSYFSYGNTVQKGLIENNKFARHNLLFKESFLLFDKNLKIDVSANYITQTVRNRPVIGKGFSSLLGLYRTPSAVDLRYFNRNRTHTATSDDYVVTAGTGNSKLIGEQVQTWGWQELWVNNPYFMLDAVRDELKRDRFMTSVTARYNITKELNVQGRASVDKITDRSLATRDASIFTNITVPTQNAHYWSGNSAHQEVYADALASYNTQIEKVTVSATVGTSMKRIQDNNSWITKMTDTTYVKPNLAWPLPGGGNFGSGASNTNYRGGNLDAGASGNMTNWESAVFATTQIGILNKAYIEASFRNDWAKAFQQFSKANKFRSFPYWSIGGNVLLKELLPSYLPHFDSFKLRGSYSVVGNSIPNGLYYAQTIDPISGALGARPPAFDNPMPEQTKSVEVGIDGSLFQNQFDFDLTFYQAIMENQFITIGVASSNQAKPINSGKVRNRGVEFTGNFQRSFNRNIRWRTGVTMAYNDNKILKTYRYPDGSSQELTVGPGSLGIKSYYREGGSYGDLYVKDFQYDSDGKIVLNDGRPALTQEYTKFVGNTASKFTFGWNNTLSYKQLSFYMLIDGKLGGKVVSLSQAEMDEYGLSERSALARQTNNGMVTLPDGQTVTARNYYETMGAEQATCFYDATNLRIREISLGYTFLDLFGPGKNIVVSVVGRNLLFLYKKSPVDPDISVSAANGASGIETFSLPTTRSFGFNLKLSF
ncbi:MAG: SusC/RagA family TonB-linked outer membrane protein [Bacteroidales bacterium]